MCVTEGAGTAAQAACLAAASLNRRRVSFLEARAPARTALTAALRALRSSGVSPGWRAGGGGGGGECGAAPLSSATTVGRGARGSPLRPVPRGRPVLEDSRICGTGPVEAVAMEESARGGAPRRRRRRSPLAPPPRPGLVQHYIMLNEGEKNRKLNDLLDALDFNQARQTEGVGEADVFYSDPQTSTPTPPPRPPRRSSFSSSRSRAPRSSTSCSWNATFRPSASTAA